LSQNSGGALAELSAVTDSFPFTQRTQFTPGGKDELLCASAQLLPSLDAAESQAWSDWAGVRASPRAILGQAFQAATAWQCVIACDAIRRNEFAGANVSVVGANQQAIGARFVKPVLGGNV
jgi:hypothetical protein